MSSEAADLVFVPQRPVIVQASPDAEASPDALELTDGRHRLIPIQTTGSKPPLFWIPGGFGSVRMTRLRDLAVRFGPDQPMYGLGTPPAQRLDEIESATERATAYVALIRELQPQGPYFLAGFCLGGTLAFEAAQQLRAQGQQVAFLALLNAWIPISTITARQWAFILAYRLKHHFEIASRVGWRRGGRYLVSRLDAIPKLYRRGRQMRRVPCTDPVAACSEGVPGVPAGGASPKRLLWSTIRIWGKYLPQPFPGKVHLFLSDEADLAGVGPKVDPRRGWARVCSSCEIVELEGEHVQMLESPMLDSFAERFAHCLTEAQRAVAPATVRSMTA